MLCFKYILKSLYRPLPNNILPAWIFIFTLGPAYLNVHGKRNQFYLQTLKISPPLILQHSPVCHQWSKTGTLKTFFDHSSVSTSQCSPATNNVLNLQIKIKKYISWSGWGKENKITNSVNSSAQCPRKREKGREDFYSLYAPSY